MIKVYIAQDPLDAHVLKGLLESQGISCEVRGENLWAARGELPMTTDTLPSVWIHDKAQFDEAKAFVQQYEAKGTQGKREESIWICPKCRVPIGRQFSECWKCGTRRAGTGQDSQ